MQHIKSPGEHKEAPFATALDQASKSRNVKKEYCSFDDKNEKVCFRVAGGDKTTLVFKLRKIYTKTQAN